VYVKDKEMAITSNGDECDKELSDIEKVEEREQNNQQYSWLDWRETKTITRGRDIYSRVLNT
jgi:hypothetical protein